MRARSHRPSNARFDERCGWCRPIDPLAPAARRRHRVRGFSLLELMITVVVVAVLATIAYPSYSAYVARARRAEVKATLLDAAAWMEQNFVLQGNSYLTPAPDTDLATAGFDRSPRGAAQPFYSIAFRSTPTATRFELVATPNAAVWAEPLCTELSIDQDGARTATGSWSATDCWNR